MEVEEISSRMDYALQKQNFGILLDEYNKSLYLTKAQERFITQVISVYEYTDAMRHILGPLLITQENDFTDFTPNGQPLMWDLIPVDKIKEIVYEYLNDQIMLIPLDWNDIHKTRPNPFRKPYSKLSYRITGKDNFTIFTSETPTKYVYVYCKEPDPIILETLTGSGLQIGGSSLKKTSELPNDSVLTVIELAVNLALEDITKLTSRQERQAEKN